jgi:2-oxoglutarate dehydrogenase E1 component
VADVGPNEWLVEEMFDQYKADPNSVPESWREFFADYRAGNGAVPAPAPVAPAAAAPTPVVAAAPEEPAEPEGAPIRGAAARIVANMEQSLGVPTATSVRQVPAKLLEVNRRILNNHLGRTRGGKVSFTHLIGYAVVRAANKMPVMNSSFVDGDPARVITHKNLGLGLAVDQTKSDGSHTLLVPVIKNANHLEFHGFWMAYEDLIRKVRTSKITPDDFAGVTMSLTNPGTIGTVSSVPRLMPGQGAIIGVGALDYPAEYQAADPSTLARLGVSKVITLTSTYDHRIIQGAESGEFLQWVHKFLIGEEGFYDDIFRSMGVPYEPVRWRRDATGDSLDEERSRYAKQVHVHTLINMYRVRGHLIADLDPLAAKEPHMHAELDPATYGLTLWDLDREFYADGLAGHEVMTLGDILGILRDAYCRTVGVEYMHIQDFAEQRWIQSKVEGVQRVVSKERKQRIVERLNAAEAF